METSRLARTANAKPLQPQASHDPAPVKPHSPGQRQQQLQGQPSQLPKPHPSANGRSADEAHSLGQPNRDGCSKHALHAEHPAPANALNRAAAQAGHKHEAPPARAGGAKRLAALAVQTYSATFTSLRISSSCRSSASTVSFSTSISASSSSTERLSTSTEVARL